VTRAARSATVDSGGDAPRPIAHDRPWYARAWYGFMRYMVLVLFTATGGLRARGRDNVPKSGGALLVSNHLSYLDVFIVGVAARRPLNYVARSTLFFPPLGALIRSVGGFPIQRDGMGSSGLKETLRRLRNGGIVILFPEGTRSLDGSLGEMKPGIAVLASRAKTPLIPAGLAGTYEGWSRHRLFPLPHPIRVEYGRPILPEELAGLSPEQITSLIREQIDACQRHALRDLARDMRIDLPEELGGSPAAISG
jgi:1-acyl-sn-glycerol-3-phosphate acyltransferase